ncbi:MAG TPA: hypothetical protein EYQ39_04975 [Gemmatimonadetes bacterium]|nr:hypothetical protein [Gemmatimonadota bacterium]HIL90414.1 hypothetical protein [Gemmatimonadota bacterium]
MSRLTSPDSSYRTYYSSSTLDGPHGVYVHEEIVYVTDSESHRVRALYFTGAPE